ncbi:MAG: flagellar basal body rod protein FlgB [Hylemonella sp.]|jgi:flagellar basal-body rod protein FlgB|uniref:flagellar basal body rod protein FlgB n=1 Tax=Hylemonella sp. TaxID=2066020 RepID=UPI00391C8821
MSSSAKFLPINGAAGAAATDEEWRGRAVILRAHRQALLASNIANADTPGYQARDFDFSDAMRDAMKRLPGPALQVTSTKHVGTTAPAITSQSTLDFARYVVPSQPSLDNNSVDMDRERGVFMKNAILYQMSLSTYEDEFKEFKLAASDPRR